MWSVYFLRQYSKCATNEFQAQRLVFIPAPTFHSYTVKQTSNTFDALKHIYEHINTLFGWIYTLYLTSSYYKCIKYWLNQYEVKTNLKYELHENCASYFGDSKITVYLAQALSGPAFGSNQTLLYGKIFSHLSRRIQCC